MSVTTSIGFDTSVRGGYAELWLRPVDPALPVLPRRLAPALADSASALERRTAEQAPPAAAQPGLRGQVFQPKTV